MAHPRHHQRPDRRRRISFSTLREDLEVRVVPATASFATSSMLPAGTIAPLDTVTPDGSSESPTGYTPQQIRTAYGFDGVKFGSIVGDGAGQTIAIVDAYDDPGLVDSSAANFSSSDLARFDRQFGLPDPPSFTKLNQQGNASPLPATDPAGAGNPSGTWESEEAMDVEWAHALAPSASIVLIEASSGNLSDLNAAVGVADDLAGVSVVSMSWGGSESSGETNLDKTYQTPGGHQGVTFVASSGDSGAPGIYPAYSPGVLAVGGTSLQLNADGSIQGETAWSDSGGGTSSYEAEPSYQKGVQSTGYRTIPDVAFDASNGSGVSVYDSYDNTGGGPWITMFGTSLGAPSWSALIAVADQGRVAAGGTTLDGPSQTLPALYSLPSADFHDITSGSNGGENAGPGYDQVTGLGSPVANLLAPGLAFYGMSDHLAITTQPGSSLPAGQAFGMTVEVEAPDGTVDPAASGTLTIAIADQPGGASLGGTLTATIHDGIATFNGLSIDLAGSGYALSVSGGAYSPVTSSSFAVTPAAASQLVIESGPPSSLAAGAAFGLTVSVEDPYGNLETSYNGEVTLGLAGGPAGAALDGATSEPASGGVATFSGLDLTAAGSGYTLEATAPDLPSTQSVTFAVTPAAPARLVLTQQPPSSLSAGSPFGLAVSIKDAFGNPVSGYAGTVTVSLERGADGRMLLGDTSMPATQGVATFSGLAIDQAGGDVLEVTAEGVGSLSTAPLQVVPAAPSQLVLVDAPSSPLIAGQSFGFTAAVEDPYGNVATQFSGTVTATLAQAPAGGSLPGPISVQAVSGVATFTGLALDEAGGGYAVEATSVGLSPATSAAITVAPASPSRLVVTLQPPGRVVAGRPFAVGVEALDAYGNVVTGFDGTVTAALASGPGHDILEGDVSVPAHDGQALITVAVLKKAATPQTITITSSGLTPALTSVFDVKKPARGRMATTIRHLSRSPLMRHPVITRRVRPDRPELRAERPDHVRR